MIAPHSSSLMAGRRGVIATKSTGRRLMLALCLVSYVVRTSVAEPTKVYDIDLPAESVTDALNGLSEQTGVPVVFSYDLAKGRMANPVVGRNTLVGALDALLRNTGLSGGLSDKGVVILTRKEPRAPENTGETSVTQDQNKQNTSSTKTGRRAAVAAFFGSIVAAFSASAAEDTAADAGDDQAKMVSVVVTAEKREERELDVPVAMTVLNPQALAEQGQDRLVDYFSSVPGLSISGNPATGGQAYVTIRGLSAGFSQNPTIATVIDDVPVGSSQVIADGALTQPDLDPSDLARIEVLKGPQGTLYGADSLGGLVKYVTTNPSTSGFSGRAEITGVDIDGGGVGYTVRAAANIPVSETLAIRISGFSRRDPGYVDDLTTGQNNINSADVYGGHLSLLYRPSEDLSLKLTALTQDTNANGTGFINSNVLGQFTQGDLKQTGLPGSTPWDTRWQLYTATLNAKVAGLDLVSVTGYNTNLLHSYYDLTGCCGYGALAASIVPGAFAYVGEDHYYTEKFSQEVRVSSSVQHWLDWTLGAFYTHETSPGTVQYNYAADLTTGVHEGLIATFDYWPLTLSEKALFGDVTFHVTNQFDVQLGGRQSWNTLDYSPISTGPAVKIFDGVTPYVQPPGHASGSPFTYLVTPKYTISSDLQAYARIASGYRIGGPNLVSGTGLYKDVPSDYKPDKTTNYELGIKGDVLDHRLSFDAAAYYINWNNFQLNIQIPGAVASYTANVGNAKSEGVELSVEAHPVSGLTLALQGSYGNAVLKQDLPPAAVANFIYGVAGDRLPYSIRWSGGFTVNQDIRLSNDWVGFLSGAVNYVGSRPGEFAYTATYPRTWMPAYTQFNLRAGARYQSWLINLYVNNVADKRGVVGITPFGANYGNTGGSLTTVTQPRTVGLTLAKSF